MKAGREEIARSKFWSLGRATSPPVPQTFDHPDFFALVGSWSWVLTLHLDQRRLALGRSCPGPVLAAHRGMVKADRDASLGMDALMMAVWRRGKRMRCCIIRTKGLGTE